MMREEVKFRAEIFESTFFTRIDKQICPKGENEGLQKEMIIILSSKVPIKTEEDLLFAKKKINNIFYEKYFLSGIFE